jgi:hypothetical protein
MQIRPVGAELFHEDGRTDMTKLIAAFLRTCLKISGEKNFIVLFYCVCYYEYVVNQIAFQDILGLPFELNEDASCLSGIDW